MIALAIFAAVQSSQPLAMPTDYRGISSCRVATRRTELSVFDIWVRDGAASTPGDEAAGLPAVRDAKVESEEQVEQDDMRYESMRFRSGSATVDLKRYKRARFHNWMYLTVRVDEDETNALPRETAAGFCIPVAVAPGGAA